jgi:hypothetical protein
MTRDQCHKHAEECLQLAERAEEPERSKLLELAHAWMDLADEGVTLVPPEPVYSPVLKANAKPR